MLVCANIVTLKETLPKNLKGGHHALSVCKVRRRPNGHPDWRFPPRSGATWKILESP